MRGRKQARLGIGLIAAALMGLVVFFPASSRATQCAPYAREISGIDLYGAAWTWWGSAEGQYQRGHKPQVGAALVFKRLRGMPAGHVAVVTAVVDSRTIRVSHANWVHRRGQGGAIEYDVAIVDQSRANDWSVVRVWYEPVGDLGNKPYPTYGFVYPAGSHRRQASLD